MWNGILNVHKEAGYTSNDVVAKLRGILHQRRIGHAGTLDPDATGVLPVLLGNGCRISEYMMDHDKTYHACLLLGVTTDTQDMSGEILAESGTDDLTEETVREAVMSFVGEYDQIPPMYSAKKVGGKRLCDLAREGRTVERKPVRVRISSIQILRIAIPEVEFSVECSKGTYIRTLCADIGEKLSCGAAMKSLVRTRVGGFYLEDALTLDRIRELADSGTLNDRVIPVEEMFLDHLRARTVPEADRKLLNGNRLSCRELGLPSRGAGDMIRVCTSAGEFAAVYRFDPERGDYVPWRMLPEI